MALRSLKITETGAIRKLGCGFLFAFDISMAVSLAISETHSASKNDVTLKCGFGVVQGH